MPRVQGRRMGYMQHTRPDGTTAHEADTFTCGHCQHVTEVPQGQTLDDLGCFCLACCRPCCRGCSAKMAAGGMCDPFEKKLERAEAAARGREKLFQAMTG